MSQRIDQGPAEFPTVFLLCRSKAEPSASPCTVERSLLHGTNHQKALYFISLDSLVLRSGWSRAPHLTGYPAEGEVLKHSSEPGDKSVIEALRNATRSRHADLGSIPTMLRLFDSDYSISEYRAHLGRLLGFFEPLEYVAARAAEADGSVCPFARSSDLREDLRFMGATASEIESLERCQQLPMISPGGLRGYTYVILGSTLGAKVIVKQLRASLGPDASFRFYGDENGRSEAAWALFRSDLEENGKTEVEAICETSVGVFDAYTAWFSEPLLRIGG